MNTLLDYQEFTKVALERFGQGYVNLHARLFCHPYIERMRVVPKALIWMVPPRSWLLDLQASTHVDVCRSACWNINRLVDFLSFTVGKNTCVVF